MDVPAQVASTADEGGDLAAGGVGGGVGEGSVGAGAGAAGGGGGGAAAAGGGEAGGGDYGGAGAGAAGAAPINRAVSSIMPSFLPDKVENTHVAEKPQGGARTSIAWRFFEKFFPPLEDGKNVKCTLKRDDGTDCKALYKHDNEANTGTGSMVRHLRRCKDASHAQAIQEFDAESKHYSSGAAAKGVSKGATKGAAKGASKGARSSTPAKEERKGQLQSA